MDVTLKVIRDTVVKQSTQDSSEISNSADLYEIKKGQELKLHSWEEAENAHVRVAFLNTQLNGKNTWYAYDEHIEIWQANAKLFPKVVSMMLEEVTHEVSCTTDVVRGLDQQIIQEMNLVIPNALVSFEDLNVKLGKAVWPLLQPSAKSALERAIRERGIAMEVNSAYRTIAQQLILYNHYKRGRQCGIVLAARPPRSNHQSGLAIDINDAYGWRPYLQRHGWRWLGPSDPVHFDYVGWGTRDLREVAVLAFQRLWNRNNVNDRLLEDGAYGWQTESRLNRSYIEGFAVVPPTSVFRVLRLSEPFMQGKDVTKVQEALKKKGFNLLVDGIYGPGTETLIKEFQRKNNMVAEGIVGPKTRAELGL